MSNDKTNKQSDLNPKDKINGIIKLIYNGNIIKFKRMDDDNAANNQSIFNKLDVKATGNTDSRNNNHTGNNHETKLLNQSHYQKVFYNYLKSFKESDSTEEKKVFSRKRLKRHVKIRFDNNKTTVKPKKEDDELFVEIETHFDSKGTKGEKKKKLIRDLIEKIQNAIHSDNNTHKKKQKHWHVKKRMQNPLSGKSATALLNKLILPLETLAHRHLDPISKTVPIHGEKPLVTNIFAHNHWDNPYYSPRFFGKSINSAEMNTVDIDYNKVMKHNGIPQRLQKPLNTDMSDEVFQDSRIVDLGNLKFLMKDIDGTGFSIGFNQYTDEAPDIETMKLFSGLENIIQSYHQQYDQEPTPNAQEKNIYDNTKQVLNNDGNINNEESDQHVIQRRSVLDSNENDYHPNGYRIVYSHNSIPLKNYNEIVDSDKPKPSKIKNMKVYTRKNSKNSAFIIDENIFERDLKPTEILSIADLFQRKKRSLKVKKISNVKLKSKFNRYLNTKKMASKSIFMNKKQTKRSKRQIEKIRIIARDLPEYGKSGEENMFVVSGDKLFADRALIKEVELPEMEPNDKVHSIEHYDIVSPQREEEEPYDMISQSSQKVNDDHEDQFDILSPNVYELNPFERQNEFSRPARHNSLMSKYPHIIMEDTPSNINHGEEFLIDNNQQFTIEATTQPAVPTIIDIPLPNDQEITDLISPPKDHSNYRVSVRIRPKNSTNMSGFKEVHTSINKSYNKNGLTYTSLVNVSQLSKVEKVNKTLSRKDLIESEPATEQKNILRQQQDIIKSLIHQHKQRLEMQLKHLQSEKLKLETMYNETPDSERNNVSENILDHLTNLNLKKVRKPLQEEERKKKNHVTTSTTQIPTTESTTTEIVQTTTNDIILKTKMIETIERNENITNELLKKIDQNTGVLKIFLGKLIAKIDVSSNNAEITPPKKEDTSNTNNCPNINESSTDNPAIATKPHVINGQNINNDHVPFNFEDYHYMPNMLFRNMPKQTNNSYGIPFVYAVQQPFGAMPNRESMASVIYHGHIHTNTMNENNIKNRDMKDPTVKVVLNDKIKIVTEKKHVDADFWKPKPGEKVLHDFVVNKNNSHFFLDDAQNNFKIVPLGDQAKNTFPLNLVNGTKV